MPDKHRDDEQLPPIPDGGLSASMPEWLRRPPAWRTLPDAEVVQSEPGKSGELPEADTSVIDPRTFLTDDDLPEWLRRFGESARGVAAPEGQASASAETATIEAPRDEPEREVQPAPDASARFAPRASVIVRASGAERSPASPESRQAPVSGPVTNPTGSRSGRGSTYRAGWWQGSQLAILLAVALVIALIVIAILVI